MSCPPFALTANVSTSIPMLGAKGKHDYITMGGMFTVLKVRDGLTSYDDPGWYRHPPGTLARKVTLG